MHETTGDKIGQRVQELEDGLTAMQEMISKLNSGSPYFLIDKINSKCKELLKK